MGGDGIEAAAVATACATADVHPLLCAVAHRTGDLSLLREEFAPDQAQLLVPGCGLAPEQQAEARALAVAALSDHLASGRPDHRPDPRGTPAHLRVPGRRRHGRALGRLPDRGAGAPGHATRVDPRGAPTTSDTGFAAPSSAPAPRAWRRRTACARPVWSSRCSRRTTTWAGRGSRTCTRVAGSTCRTSSTASPSPRRTSGSPASRPSPTSWPTSSRRRRISGWGSASASAAR